MTQNSNRNHRIGPVGMRQVGIRVDEREGTYAAGARHKLRWILAEYIERTDQCSTLRGPPRYTGLFRTPVLTLVWF
jgi:hypothetical protein